MKIAFFRIKKKQLFGLFLELFPIGNYNRFLVVVSNNDQKLPQNVLKAKFNPNLSNTIKTPIFKTLFE